MAEQLRIYKWKKTTLKCYTIEENINQNMPSGQITINRNNRENKDNLQDIFAVTQ